MKHDRYFSESNTADAERTDAASDVDFDAAKGILKNNIKKYNLKSYINNEAYMILKYLLNQYLLRSFLFRIKRH